MKRQQSGFTLIELIMVIVILGILSAFALPKFADLSGNAEIASVEGARAAVKSASAIAHAQALVTSTTTGDITIEGTTVTLVNSYPNAATICAAAGADEDFNCDTATTAGDSIISISGTAGDPCFTYTQAGTAPDITTVGTIQADDTCNGT